MGDALGRGPPPMIWPPRPPFFRDSHDEGPKTVLGILELVDNCLKLRMHRFRVISDVARH